MQYQINQLKVLVSDATPLDVLLKQKYHLKHFNYQILSKSIDARDKKAVYYVYSILISTDEVLKQKNVTRYQEKSYHIEYPKWQEKYSPVIVGFGPAGIFAGLYLARCQANPIIIERGSAMDQRIADVENFLAHRKLNVNSNIQFGEGGAGTFSDGKLTTTLKSPYIRFILEEFVKHGAHEDILYDHMPHIGTDVIRKVIKNIREEMQDLGAQFYFNTTFYKVEPIEDGVEVYAGKKQFITSHLLLGIGHSARDTIRYLYHDLHLKMEPKAFSMGVRIEHDAAKISAAQYGSFAQYLPKAYYKLAMHTEDRGIYTFCMCPGGYVMASTSEKESIVTNGMSNYQREGNNSNSALLVDVRPEDYGNEVLAGLDYQEYYEHQAYLLGKNDSAPANLVKEFLKDEIATHIRSVQPTYPHGITFADLRKCLPDYVISGIKTGLIHFDHKLKGFADPDAILVGIESRSSSVVRILRNDEKKSSNPYLYPIGEGAGYAGGITSSALDGLTTAMTIIKALYDKKNL